MQLCSMQIQVICMPAQQLVGSLRPPCCAQSNHMGLPALVPILTLSELFSSYILPLMP